MSNLIQILGQVAGVADHALQLAGKSGNVKEVAAATAQGALVIAAPDGPARDALLASVRHLEGHGPLRDALAAHLPHLPAQHLAVALALVDGLTAAYENDGALDAGEIMGLVSAALREVA